MRPRVDAHVAAALLRVADAVTGEVLAGSPGLRARGAGQRQAWVNEFPLHARALAAAVDLRAPAVLAAHVRWMACMHDAAGLPQDALGACLEAIARRVGALELPDEVRRWTATALEAGIAAASAPVHDVPAEPWDATVAALRGDRAAYVAAVEAWRTGRGVRTALLGIAHVQRQVGEAWMRSEASILEERRASGLATLGIALLARETWAAPGPRRRGPALLAAAPGDLHTIGLQLAAGLLETEGYAVEMLGADVPGVQLAVACVERKPTLVGIGVSALEHLPAAREAIEVVRDSSPHPCIAVGGFAARAAGAAPLGADLLVPEGFDGGLRGGDEVADPAAQDAP